MNSVRAEDATTTTNVLFPAELEVEIVTFTFLSKAEENAREAISVFCPPAPALSLLRSE